MSKVSIEVLASQVEAQLKAMQAAGADMRPAWSAVGNALVNRIRLGFRMSRDPWGVPWHPIKWRAPRVVYKSVKVAGPTQPGQKAVVRYERKRNASGKLVLTKVGQKQVAANAAGTPGKALVDTGRLRASILADVDASGVEVGTNVRYARVHQFGKTILPKRGPFLIFPGPSGEMIFAKRVTIPARPFMPVNRAGQLSLPTTWAANITRTLAEHFNLNQPVTA